MYYNRFIASEKKRSQKKYDRQSRDVLFTLLIKLKYRAEISAGKHAVSKSGQRGIGRGRMKERDLLKAKPPRQTEASRAAAMSPAKRKKATEQKKTN